MLQPSSWCVGALLVLLTTATGLGQEVKGPALQQEAMKKLGFLVGQWKGESWSEFIPGQRSTSSGTETVETKLGGLLLVIEGLHRRKGDEKEAGNVVHSAYAVVSYDEKAKRYRIQAYTDRGKYTESEAKVADGKLEWGFEIPKFGEVRYTVTVNKNGEWSEIGEVRSDREWRTFFEMNLKRVTQAKKEKSEAPRPRSNVTHTLGVELDGVLKYAEDAVTITVKVYPRGDRGAAQVDEVWTLDLDGAGDLLKTAKALDGKAVVVRGTCRLLGVKTETYKYKYGPLSIKESKMPEAIASASVLDVEHRVQVQSLEPAKMPK